MMWDSSDLELDYIEFTQKKNIDLDKRETSLSKTLAADDKTESLRTSTNRNDSQNKVTLLLCS